MTNPTIREHLHHLFKLPESERLLWLRGKLKDFLDFAKAAVTALALYASSLSTYDLTKHSGSWLTARTSNALLVATWAVYGGATIWWMLTWNHERTRRVVTFFCLVVLVIAIIGADALQAAH